MELGFTRGTRGFHEKIDIPAEVTCAFRLLGGQGSHFRLEPGHPVTLVVSVRSLRQSPRFVLEARKRLTTLDQSGLTDLYAAHTKWWCDFWGQVLGGTGRSGTRMEDNVSNYIPWPHAAAIPTIRRESPAPGSPPTSRCGPVRTPLITTTEACFYGLYSSNHIEQADPEDAPALAFVPRGEYYASEVFNCRGVIFPVKFGPVGIETTRDERHPNIATKADDKPWLRQKGGLFLGQRSDAAFGAVNMAQRWYTTYDLAYGRKIYPFIRDVALFWEDYLKFESTPAELVKATQNLPEGLRQPADGRYVIYKDGANEGGQDTNPVVSIGLVRNVLKLALDLSKELDVNEPERDKWLHILSHLSPISTGERDGRSVIQRMTFTYIYPAGQIGLGSDPMLLGIARDMVDTRTGGPRLTARLPSSRLQPESGTIRSCS